MTRDYKYALSFVNCHQRDVFQRSVRLCVVTLSAIALQGAAQTALVSNAFAQELGKLITLRGSAFDSLSGRPLAAATVRIIGRDGFSRSDANGRFQFDSLTTGTYMVVMEHDRIDAIGLSEVVTRTTVSSSQHEVDLAIPSFRTLWRGACGASSVPSDSGFVYGAIRDAESQRGLPNARVAISWIDYGLGPAKKIKQTRFTLETITDSTGAYVACGVPVDAPLQISAGVDSLPVDTLDLPPHAERVQRRDLLVATSTTNLVTDLAFTRTASPRIADTPAVTTRIDVRNKGVIAGRITAADGTPISGVRIAVHSASEARSDSSGNYILRDVPVGTRTVEFSSIGSLPVSRFVDVVFGETTIPPVKMERVTTLDRVNVKATVASETMRSLEERKRMGFGYIEDSTYVSKLPTVASAFRQFPSVRMGVGREPPIILGTCGANYFVNRARVDKLAFYAVSIHEIAWIEVYPRSSTLPREFMTSSNRCGAVVIFTKQNVDR